MAQQKITYNRPWLYPEQLKAFFNAKRYGIIEASTKAGKTVSAISWLLERSILGKSNQNRWWIAPVYPQAKIAYSRMKAAIPQSLYKYHDTDLRITLINGTHIWFKSGEKPDNLYGEDVYDAVIDEASRLREESWHAVRSTLTATRGFVRIIGNVKGRKNWFYNLARKAQSGDPDMQYAKITAYDAVRAGVLDVKEIEDAKRQLPENVFKELYLAEPSDDGGNPFGIKAIQDCIKPLSDKPVKCWGIDLAKSHDWTVAIGLDASGDVCRFERFQRSWEDTIRVLREIVKEPALFDSTGVGDPVGESLQKNNGNFEGYKFTSPSKQQLMEGLAIAIQQQKVGYPAGVIANELECFEYEYTATGVRYCVAPLTPILTKDLRWVSADSLAVGDELLAFDEYATKAKGRCWRKSIVEQTGKINRPCYKLTLEDGTILTASAEHRWLVMVGNKPEWRLTSELRARHLTKKSLRLAPSRLLRVSHVWSEATSYEAGYLAATLDGEGSIDQNYRKDHGGNNARLSFAQRDNAMAFYARECLSAFGFSWSEFGGNGKNNDVIAFCVKGRRPEFIRFLGQIRPKRLLAKFDPDKLGSFDVMQCVAIQSIEYIGEQQVIALGTSTRTFIANGFASHNSAPEGLHDDCVCALALAVRKLTLPGLGDNLLSYYQLKQQSDK